MNNVFDDIHVDLPEELVESLVECGGLRIERIVSRGHTTADGEWYDQESDEFVLLLKGSAVLEFADGHNHSLGPGDWMVIPAHSRHRVVKTDSATESVWLCVHYRYEKPE